jgi:hypothetical protein
MLTHDFSVGDVNELPAPTTPTRAADRRKAPPFA